MPENNLFELYKNCLPVLLKGSLMTIQISLLGIFFGFLLGATLGVFDCDRLRKPIVTQLIRAYVGLFRGTPLFVQLLIVYFAIPDALGIELSPISAGVITLSVNSSAYLAEVVRAGINSISLGQWDAAYTLGYSKAKTFRYIILPQAIKNVLPALTNEFATLIKESSILMVIGVPELIKVSKDIVARNLRPMEIYLMVAFFYLIMTMLVAMVAKIIDQRSKR